MCRGCRFESIETVTAYAHELFHNEIDYPISATTSVEQGISFSKPGLKCSIWENRLSEAGHTPSRDHGCLCIFCGCACTPVGKYAVNQSEQEVWLHIARRRNSVTICNSADDLSKLFDIEYFHSHVEALSLIAKRFEAGPFTVCVLSEVDILHDCILQADTSSSAACLELLGDMESSADEQSSSAHSSTSARGRHLPMSARHAASSPTLATDALVSDKTAPRASLTDRSEARKTPSVSGNVLIESGASTNSDASVCADREHEVGIELSSDDEDPNDSAPTAADPLHCLPLPTSLQEVVGMHSPARQFETDVVTFMRILGEKNTVEEVFDVMRLPDYCTSVSSSSLDTTRQTMIDTMWKVKSEGMDSKADVDVFAPLWSCHPYKLAVFVEALARKVTLPAIKLLDSIKCVTSSVLHKDLCTEWDDYTLIQRFWSVITTDP